MRAPKKKTRAALLNRASSGGGHVRLARGQAIDPDLDYVWTRWMYNVSHCIRTCQTS